MKAVTTLEHGVRRAFKGAATSLQERMEGFSKMRDDIASQPYTKAVLNRLEFSSQEEATEDVELLALQASSFSALLSNVNLGKS